MLGLLYLFRRAIPAASPFIEAYLATGDETAILAMCDMIEEGDGVTFHESAAAVRRSITGGNP